MAYGFWVIASLFRRSLDAKRRGYFSLIALYYGKKSHNHEKQEAFFFIGWPKNYILNLCNRFSPGGEMLFIRIIRIIFHSFETFFILLMIRHRTGTTSGLADSIQPFWL